MPLQRRESSVRPIKTPKRGAASHRSIVNVCTDVEREQRIRTLFLHRAASYGLHEAARIIGVSPGVLRREAEHDQREAYRSKDAWCFTWRQVAYAAMRRWTFAEIHEALAEDARVVLPPLFAPQTITVQLPEYLVRAMETAAIDEGTTLDDWLRLELIDFAGTVVDEMDALHPGFRRAYLFPGQE